jgi:sialic acid synthase SpsE/mannose-6-phosphate isomerase-like protein (cupin superfamily)
MFYIFEMANNHMGSVDHAKKIIDDFADLAKRKNINAGIKLQFRNLDTFIHPDYQDRNDLKYVKRFNETRLNKEQFGEIINYIHSSGLLSVSTPFDNESLPLFDELGVEVLKIASCSVDDWPLLKEASKINRKIIISTGGATVKHLNKVYDLFKKEGRDFAFLHCIAEYPTPIENAFLYRIKKLKDEFPDIEIGYSTHEGPNQRSVSPYAVAMGATILEKHIGKETDTIDLNAYSCNAEQMETVIDEIQLFEKSSRGDFTKSEALEKLKRGVYSKIEINSGYIIKESDLYYAMPLQEGCLNASHVPNMIGKKLLVDIDRNAPFKEEHLIDPEREKILEGLKIKFNIILNEAGVTVTRKDDVELSCHFGLENFNETGALIVSKINRTYCKKIIAMLPNQSHPTHRHLQKEECFELLKGDCVLTLNGRDIQLEKGKPILINRKVDHSFRTENGCVIEEVSTTHVKGDSIYENPAISKLTVDERKISICL